MLYAVLLALLISSCSSSYSQAYPTYDPFAPVGITPPVCRFLDLLLLHCLRLESPPDTTAEIAANGRNQEKVAARGREPGLMLARGSQQVALEEWGGQLIAECAPRDRKSVV